MEDLSLSIQTVDAQLAEMPRSPVKRCTGCNRPLGPRDCRCGSPLAVLVAGEGAETSVTEGAGEVTSRDITHLYPRGWGGGR